ncbi:SCP2 sterol-binding domain-containing protein [Microdochium trichocladiopsis]|uniref:SCP2 sterol-binding domain-containing protein n=1 Tax=Microdochium trichocladiopsis TaxID=1682393 RepID=A0A9P9BJU9_9PEZI|nr:SCP2 sterol-binding domain-containing protein [Microdochium trichocladiopsis]KAH7025959.1 SCP2 sterol-binding domain-containing protein [Microdochium trichocladiopsis]
MSVKNDEFPSSAAFDAINAVLQGDEAERKSAIKQANAVFAFTLKNAAGKEESWHIDLKDKGAVGKGTGEKPTGMSHLSRRHEDFGKLVAGKADPQRLFMGGKLKAKGDIMKATKMQPILAKARSSAKL